MKYLPWLLVAVLFGIILGYFITSSQPALEIGLVNMGKIIDESPRARELNQQLSKRYNQLLGEIEQQREVLDEEAQAELERSAYATYLKFRQELESQFQTALDKAISDVAEEQNVKIVLDEDLVRYGGKDLSVQVIRRLK